ncbi:MAG: branched-chain amino acid ABC transporter permease [Actinobacteria bacterium]|nr:branched-chain amino acid ABC transporter permease [Actinomycetota bacterium]
MARTERADDAITEATQPAGVEPSADGRARHAIVLADPRERWRPSPIGVIARLAVIAFYILLVIAIPHLIPGTLVNVAARAAVFAIVAVSMNVLMGYAGQVSLGHQAFVGVGAFTSAYFLSEAGMPYPFALAASLATGAGAALVLGMVALRVRGLYLALITIAYGLFAKEVIFNIRSLTGGGAGLRAPRPGVFDSDIAYVYFCAAVLGLILVFDWRLTATKAGRAIEALRDDERVASSWGINVTAYKLLAFVISGSIAGLAGALFAGIEQVVSPIDFDFTLALTFVLMTVVGGLGNRWGVIQGGIFFAILPTLLEKGHSNWHFFPFTQLNAQWEPLIGALLLILTLVQFPGGIAQQQEHLLRWLRFQPFRADPVVDPALAGRKRKRGAGPSGQASGLAGPDVPGLADARPSERGTDG